MTPVNPSLPQSDIKSKITDNIVSLANCFAAAMAITQVIRPIVEGYQRAILKKHQFTNQENVNRVNSRLNELGRGSEDLKVEIILDPNRVYQLSEEDFNTYLSDCQVEQQKANLKTENKDQCPLLVAEEVERKARRAFVDAMQPISGMSTDDVLCSANGVKNLEKLADLNMRLVASMGLLKNDFTTK